MLEKILSHKSHLEVKKIYEKDIQIERISYANEKVSEKQQQEAVKKQIKIQIVCKVLEKIALDENTDNQKDRIMKIYNSIQYFSQIQHQNIVKYFGIKHFGRKNHQQNHSLNQENNGQWLQILSEDNLLKFQIAEFIENQNKIKNKNFKEMFAEKFYLFLQILRVIKKAHEMNFAFFPNHLQNVLFCNNEKTIIKIAMHKFSKIELITQEQIQERKMKEASKFKKAVLKNTYSALDQPEFLSKIIAIKDLRANDMWKIGIFALNFLFPKIILTEEMQKLTNIQGILQSDLKQYVFLPIERIIKANQYIPQHFCKKIIECLKIYPQERIKIQQLCQESQKLYESFIQTRYSAHNVRKSKSKYLEGIQKIDHRFIIQLKEKQEILSVENKKKITDYFKSSQNRVVKEYKLIFRASFFKYSSKKFHEICFQKQNVLVVFVQKKEKKKIICYTEVGFDLTKCNGIFGNFVKDEKKHSFIYSPSQNQFCKLKDAEKSICVSHIHGPIFGDGDIVISDQCLTNFCRFPRSYESTRIKKLFKSELIEIQEYDVYSLKF